MKLHVKALSGAAIILLSLQACSKKETSSNNLNKGQAAIELTSSTTVAGKTSLKSNMPIQSVCTKGTMANTDLYTLTATQVDGTNIYTFQFTLNVTKGATTDNGNITGAFGGSGAAIGTLVFGGSNAGSNQASFGMTSGGTITITKLTSDSIEGTFSGQGKNSSTNATTSVTDGKFAGKF